MPVSAIAISAQVHRVALPGKLRRCGAALILAAWFHAGAGAAGAAHLLRPSALRCDGKSEPAAVAHAHPEFSWRLAAASPALHGVSQSAYRIQVAASEGSFAPVEGAQGILWDTGKIASAATAGIAYAGAVLEPQRAYAWRVEVWDEQQRASGWSATAHWTQTPVWHAAWIAARSSEGGEANQPLPLFRKSFRLDRPIARAMVYVSGLGQDEIRINGRKVGGRKVSNDVLTPGWSDYRKTVYFDSYDVTSLLRSGANAMGVMLGNGMYRVLRTAGRYTKFTGSYGEPKCTVQLDVDFAGGGSTEILSDGTWKAAPGPITFSSAYGGEDFDARLEPQGWDRAGFKDAAWPAAVEVPGPGGTLLPENAPPIRVMHIYSPVKVSHPKPGVLVYDLGQNFAGWPAITVAGPAGATLKLIGGELLDEHGFVTQRSSKGPQWFSYTLRGEGVETWHPRFSY